MPFGIYEHFPISKEFPVSGTGQSDHRKKTYGRLPRHPGALEKLR
jgi:hypothetical protein